MQYDEFCLHINRKITNYDFNNDNLRPSFYLKMESGKIIIFELDQLNEDNIEVAINNIKGLTAEDNILFYSFVSTVQIEVGKNILNAVLTISKNKRVDEFYYSKDHNNRIQRRKIKTQIAESICVL